MKKIILTKQHKKWQQLFQQEATKLQNLFGNEINLLAHIGSTAIENISAIPTIDILLVMPDVNLLNNYTKELKSLGYHAKGEFGIKGRKFFIKMHNSTQLCHVHAHNIADERFWNYIHFKRFLLNNPVAAKIFEQLKQQIAKQDPHNFKKYSKAKGKYFQEIEAKIQYWLLQETHQTDRLLLRPVRLTDNDMMYKYTKDKIIAESTSEIPYPLTYDMVRDWIISQINECEKGKQLVFTVEKTATKEMIGSIELVFNKHKLEAEIGYWIARPFWRQGFGYETIEAVLKFGFEELYLQRIFAISFKWNEPSTKLLRKLGMTLVDTKEIFVKKWDRNDIIEEYAIMRNNYLSK